jgi:phosphatidylinositol glycan class Z
MDLNLPTSVVLIAHLLTALTPSYIHPDEHLQGPQVIASLVFGWDVHNTWEFTANRPIRSVASLWTVYAPVMYPWKYVVGSNPGGFPLYFALRLWFALLTYLFGATHLPPSLIDPLILCSVDRSLPDIVGSTQRVQFARFLLTSSYAFLVYQSHTFSNSIETILVIQTFVLCQKLSRWPTLRTPTRFALLGVLIAYGIFNRPTFPFWTIIPLLSLLFHLSLRDV